LPRQSASAADNKFQSVPDKKGFTTYPKVASNMHLAPFLFSPSQSVSYAMLCSGKQASERSNYVSGEQRYERRMDIVARRDQPS